MRAIAAYMAARNGRERDGGDESRMTYDDRRRQEYKPDEAEMRRRRDGHGRYMEDGGGMEDARAYQARNEYRPQRDEYGRAENRYTPYMPDIQPQGGLYDGGGIGFGTRDREYETRAHYGGEEEHGKRMSATGMVWMDEGKHPAKIDRETAEKWVSRMRGEDASRPTGEKWSAHDLHEMAEKYGIKPDSEKFWEFYAMTNAMYSDYCAVAKKFNITSPEFYGAMAKAWMDDKDAMPNKTALYYEHIVKK